MARTARRGRHSERRRSRTQVAIVAAVVVALLLQGSATLSPPALAAPSAQIPSRCLITTTLERRPDPTLMMEPFEVTLQVVPHCQPVILPRHIAVAVAIWPGSSAKTLRDAAKTLGDVVDRLADSAGAGGRIGVAIPAERGGRTCPIGTSLFRARACATNIDRLTPMSSGALAEAIRAGDRLLSSARSPYPRDAIRETLVLLAFRPASSARRAQAMLSDAECGLARRAVGQVKERGILVVTAEAGEVIGPKSSHLTKCLRRLATSPRYFFLNRLTLLQRVFQQVRGGPSPHPRSLTLRIDLPEHIAVSSASGNRANVAIRPAGVVAVGFGVGFEVTMELRSTRRGYHPSIGPLTLDWVESVGIAYQEVRPPIGHMLTLAPRRLATATPRSVSVRPWPQAATGSASDGDGDAAGEGATR